jgi:hypothetical protein
MYSDKWRFFQNWQEGNSSISESVFEPW